MFSLLKFFVLKTSDIDEYLSEDEKTILASVSYKIHAGREKAGKPHHSYVVVNMDEPYALAVSELISIGEHEKRKKAK